MKFWNWLYRATSYKGWLAFLGGRNHGGQNAIARLAVRRFAAAARKGAK